jgi:hypothetical protein
MHGIRIVPYPALVGTPEGKRARGRPKLRREYNINLDLEEI